MKNFLVVLVIGLILFLLAFGGVVSLYAAAVYGQHFIYLAFALFGAAFGIIPAIDILENKTGKKIF